MCTQEVNIKIRSFLPKEKDENQEFVDRCMALAKTKMEVYTKYPQLASILSEAGLADFSDVEKVMNSTVGDARISSQLASMKIPRIEFEDTKGNVFTL